jgi:nitrogen fixation/metabolism regulation signal transduction histidine kinase
MRIKTKLAFGISFLFAAFLIVGGTSLFFTMKISKQNRLIMKDNHLSLVYTENMLQSLDKINTIETSYLFDQKFLLDKEKLNQEIKKFEKNQFDEANNITEPGEKEAVQSLMDNFKKYRALLDNIVINLPKDKSAFYLTEISPVLVAIKTDIFRISDVNMQAIVGKNNTANETASHSYLVLSIITTICFFIFFVFIFGFPEYISNPIRELTEGVREIAGRNFQARVNFVSNDEFGEISNAFNAMAGKLEEYDNSQNSLSLNGKERSEAVMNNLQEALIIFDEHQKITFINSFAEKLLDLNPVEMLNKYAPDIALNNEFIRLLIKDIDQYQNKQNQSVNLEFNGKKTRFVKEIRLITATKRDQELIVPIGHMILLKQVADKAE